MSAVLIQPREVAHPPRIAQLPVSDVQYVSPEYAAALLKLNKKNRRVKPYLVDQLVGELKRGSWKVNGDAIRISKDGVLLDGQHRLLAIVASGIGAWSFVATGLDPESFDTIDTGRITRTVADVLRMKGEKNCSVLAAATRWVLLINATKPGGRLPVLRMSVGQMEEVLDQYPTIRSLASVYGASGQCRMLAPSAFVGVAALFAKAYDLSTVLDFVTRFDSGADLTVGDPVLALRTRCLTDRASGRKMTDRDFIPLAMKALRAHVEGRKVYKLRYIDSEALPTIKD